MAIEEMAKIKHWLARASARPMAAKLRPVSFCAYRSDGGEQSTTMKEGYEQTPLTENKVELLCNDQVSELYDNLPFYSFRF